MSLLTRPSSALALVALLLASPAGAELVRMKTRHVFLASSSEEVVATFSKDLFREPLLLKRKHPGCLVLRFSGEISGANKSGDLHVVASFELAVDDVPAIAPAFQEAPTTIPRLVSFEGYACGLPAGPHEVSVQVRGEDGDEVTVHARTLEVWTEGGRVVPSTISLVPAGR